MSSFWLVEHPDGRKWFHHVQEGSFGPNSRWTTEVLSAWVWRTRETANAVAKVTGGVPVEFARKGDAAQDERERYEARIAELEREVARLKRLASDIGLCDVHDIGREDASCSCIEQTHIPREEVRRVLTDGNLSGDQRAWGQFFCGMLGIGLEDGA